MAQPKPTQPRQSLTDLAYRTAAGILGGPVDIATMVMRPFGYRVPEQQVVGGSEWMGRQMERAGLISSARAPMRELVTSLLVPTPSGAGTAISKAIFIGAAAKTWDAAAAVKAKELEKAGVDARSIWQQTGTWKGPDGKWRQEIDDSQARAIENRAAAEFMVGPGPAEYPVGAVSNVMQHREMSAAYPSVMDIKTRLKKGEGGAYIPSTGFGEAFDLPSTGTRSTALHEMQHAVQQREGFAKGGTERGAADDVAAMIFEKKKRSSDIQKSSEFQEAQALENKLGWEAIEGKVPFEQYERTVTSHPGYPLLAEYRQLQEWLRTAPTSGLEAYRRLAGEAEARAVQSRMNLTPAQRRATFPPESYDVPIEQLIIRGIE